MAQDTDLAPPAVPTFGRHDEPLEARRYRTFGLEVEGRRTARARKEERWTETFSAYVDVDGGLLVALGQARDQMAQARATVTFLGANLRDDDGASMDYTWPATPEQEDPDDPDSDWLRGAPTPEEPDGVPLYLGWDGEVYPRDQLPPLDELRDGSSRRRFAFISDSMRIRYRFEALREVSEWLTEGIAGRPTVRPASSSRGPQRTGHGSAARRR